MIAALTAAAAAVQAFTDTARAAIAPRLAADRIAHQHIAHGLAWYATHAALLAEVAGWAARLDSEGRFGATEQALAALAFAHFGGEARAGIAMNQGEIIRPWQLTDDTGALDHPDLIRLERGAEAATAAVTAALAEGRSEDPGLDPLLVQIRDQFAGFARDRVAPHAQGWHLADALIPDSLVAELGALGVFGLTIPAAFGGAGLGKVAMCVVSEELSRGWLGVGSLATRAEIAAELILAGGTPEQQARWLPGIASGAVLPTAVFTEPGAGSDLASLTTRAERHGAAWHIHGAKTWITHAARADLMTLLVRTDPMSRDHRGLSMLLAPKPRGTTADPFPVARLSGGEIPVIGYRGMKEYELAFDGFAVPADALLGGTPDQGFRQLMATFESARIQTAARAVGVAQAALDLALAHARERRQFGRPLLAFPRVAAKLAIMAAEIMAVRQLTWAAARIKDAGRRCDTQAGMAKLLAARVAWAAADNAVQIHGGTGFAVEHPASRLLADARILNIFEGAGEIQADVIARRLIETPANPQG